MAVLLVMMVVPSALLMISFHIFIVFLDILCTFHHATVVLTFKRRLALMMLLSRFVMLDTLTLFRLLFRLLFFSMTIKPIFSKLLSAASPIKSYIFFCC
jgi:hypothetical protein